MDYFTPLNMVEDQILHHMAAGAAEVAPSCPRCASSNTKFCYYNNYSLTQPRYLCKSCRRYWTRGGSLRNVPIGGGFRKSRRSKAARTAAMKTGSPSSDRINNASSSEPSGAAADIDMATVFANFLNQSSSSADSGGGDQDSDPLLNNDVDRPRFEAETAGDDEILGLVENHDENAIVFPDEQQLLIGGQAELETADQEGLLWSDTTSSEMSNFMMTWQVQSPFPSDEFWSSGFDFSGLEVLSGSSPSIAEH